MDSDEVKDLPDGKFKTFCYPIIRSARDEVGKEIVANIISLGMITELTKIVTHQAMEKAVLKRVPKPFLDLNKKALEFGFEKAMTLI